MTVYLFGFFLSIVLFAISDKIVKRQKWFFAMVALLIPCFIAGFRAESIGVDTEGYLVPMIKAAISSDSFIEYLNSGWYRIWRNLYVKDYEFGFILVVYIVSKLFHSIAAVQFMVQLLAVIPIYLAVKKSRSRMWIGMSVYYFIYFNTSLNMMRQMIAVGLVTLALQYYIEENKKTFIMLIVLSMLFHYSGIIGLVVAPIYTYVQRDSKKNKCFGFKVKSYYINMLIVILVAIAALLSIGVIARILPYIGFGKYVNYLISATGTGRLQFLPNQVITRLPVVILFILNWKKLRKNEDKLCFYFTMVCIDIIVSQLASINTYSGRIAVYFSIYGIYSYSSLCTKGRHKLVTMAMMLGYLVFYWWYFYVLLGRDSTVPYIFMG